ncbi:MAG: hypothetical protein HYX29_00435 [Solirubrobacterales bacterium]|nr:hypothetical protein [Solirubrobacterales bacterium]
MRTHRSFIPLVALTCVLLLTTATAQAKSGSFKVSVSGTQNYSWSLDGTRGSCEIQRGAGSGTNKFTFKSPKSAPFFVSTSSGIMGSLNATAKGNRTGSFSVTTATPCPGYEPGLPMVGDASGCGEYKYNLRMDFKQKGASQYVTGPSQTYPPGACPSPIDSDILLSTDLAACGDILGILYRRSWGVSGAAGLLASKISPSIKTLLKTQKGRSKSITGKAAVECKPASTFSSPVTIRADLKYTLTFKRTS